LRARLGTTRRQPRRTIRLSNFFMAANL
jgi:hypothetical protein